MSTVRKNILEKISSILSSQGFLTKLSRILPVEFGSIPLPYCFIFVTREEKLLSGEETVVGKETWSSDVTVLLIAREADVEEHVSTIYSTLFENQELQPLIVMGSLVRIEYFVLQTTREVVGASLVWRIIYRHSLGDMEKP